MEKYILLIDDDEDELDIFTQALNKIPAPFSCSQVLNLEDAEAWLMNQKPDFIFIDYNMPRINGLECLEELKKLELPGTRFVIYSNHIDADVNGKAIRLGAMVCMKKPYMTSTLAKNLKEILMK
jgi:DNA-binding NtrC family response regulator